MTLRQKIKHYIRSAFREIIVYHNSSLEFRAKLFAIVAGANKEACDYEDETIKASALQIYHNDENRATTLWLATKEYLKKIRQNNELGIDELARDIEKLIKRNTRFVHKIDTSVLQTLVQAQKDKDTKDYQLNIIEFLDNLKEEYSPKPRVV